MKPLLAALTALVLAAAPARAAVGMHGAPLPRTAAVNMGALDKAGYGGVDLTALTGNPVVQTVTNNATGQVCTGSACDLQIDGWKQLVWAGSYGGAPTLSQGALAVGTCTLPSPTAGYTVRLQGNITLCVSVLANVEYVRSHYEGPTGTLPNPDTPTANQLFNSTTASKGALTDTSLPVGTTGATVRLRPGSGVTGTTPGFNPLVLTNIGSNGLYSFTPPTTTTATNPVALVSPYGAGLSGGSGYTTATLSLSGGGGSGATATPIIGSGVTLALTAGGANYTLPPTVKFTGGCAVEPAATATISGGAVTGFVYSFYGQTCTSPPTVSFSNDTRDTTGSGAAATASITNGMIIGAVVTNIGQGYTSAPTVSVSGDGTGAALSATLKLYLPNYPGFGAVSGYVANGVFCPVYTYGSTTGFSLGTGLSLIGVGVPFGTANGVGPTLGASSGACSGGFTVLDDLGSAATFTGLNVASSSAPQVFYLGKYLTIENEFPDASNDIDGNPNYGSSSHIGELRVTEGSSVGVGPDTWTPYRWKSLTWDDNVPFAGGYASFNGYLTGTTLCVTTPPAAGRPQIGMLDYPEYVTNETTSGAVSAFTYIKKTGQGDTACTDPVHETAYTINNAQTIGSSASPQLLYAAYPGSGGGEYKAGPNPTLLTAVTIPALYQTVNGFGMVVENSRCYLEPGITQMSGCWWLNRGQYINNHTVGSPAAVITTDNSGYSAHNASGANSTGPTVAGCIQDAAADVASGTLNYIKCYTSFVAGNYVERSGADFLDGGNRVADHDIEGNYFYNTANAVAQIAPEIGDLFSVTDNVTGVTRNYQVVPEITGAAHTCAPPYGWITGCGNVGASDDGSVYGNIPYSSNTGQMYINMACTIAGGGVSGSIDVASLTMAGVNAPTSAIVHNPHTCVVGTDYPSNAPSSPSWSARYDGSNLTQDTIYVSPRPVVTGTGSVSGNVLTLTPSSGSVARGMVLQQKASISIVTDPNNPSATTCNGVPCTGTGSNAGGTYLLSATTTGSGTLSLWDSLTVGAGSLLSAGPFNIVQGADGGPANWPTASTSDGPTWTFAALHPDFFQTLSTGVTSDYPNVEAYNLVERGSALPNVTGTQFTTNNLGGQNNCCLRINMHHNLVLETQLNLGEIHMYNGSSASPTTINFNTILADINSTAVWPAYTPTYNVYKDMQILQTTYNGTILIECDAFTGIGAVNGGYPANINGNPGANISASYNAANQIYNSTCTSARNGVAPTSLDPQTTFAVAGSGHPTFADISASLKLAIPNYPTALYPAAAGGNGCIDPISLQHNRAAMIKCLAPAMGTPFTATLSTTCQLTTSQVLPLYTMINPPIVGGAPVIPDSGNSAHTNIILSGNGSSGNPYTINRTSGCIAGTYTFATGLENPSGTYNGMLLPPDSAGVIGLNDGTVFNWSATHTPAGWVN